MEKNSGRKDEFNSEKDSGRRRVEDGERFRLEKDSERRNIQDC